MRFPTAAVFLAFVGLSSAASHVSVMLASASGITFVDVPTDNKPHNVEDHVQGFVDRAMLSTGAPGSRCRAFLDDQGTQLIGGKIVHDGDTPLGGAIKTIRCDPKLVLNGSFEISRWVGGKVGGHATGRPNPPSHPAFAGLDGARYTSSSQVPHQQSSPMPTSTSASSSTATTTSSSSSSAPTSIASPSEIVSVQISNANTGSVKSIPLDNQPFVLSKNPPSVGDVTFAGMVANADANAECNTYSDEAGSISLHRPISANQTQDFSPPDQELVSFRCYRKDGTSGHAGPSALLSEQPSTTDTSKSVSINIGNQLAASTKHIPLDGRPFVLSQNPPAISQISFATMVDDAGIGDAHCQAYDDEVARNPFGSPITARSSTMFNSKNGHLVRSFRCNLGPVAN